MKLLRVFAIVTTFNMILVNLLANILPINNQSTAQISDSFQVYFVPAGYVFSIWGIIYLGLIILCTHLLLSKQKKNNKIDKILPALILGNFANTVWIILWHYNQPVLSVVAMLILLGSLIFIFYKFNIRKDLDAGEYYFVKIPLSIYLGWISVATIANITVALYTLNWGGLGISSISWAIVMVFMATILGFTILYYFKDVFFGAVLVWAIVGIGVKFNDVSPLNFWSYIMAIAISIFCLVIAYKRFKK